MELKRNLASLLAWEKMSRGVDVRLLNLLAAHLQVDELNVGGRLVGGRDDGDRGCGDGGGGGDGG